MRVCRWYTDMGAKVESKGPGLDKIKKDLERVKQLEVLIGIPADKSQRKKDDINNAGLLYILTHGSPLRKIPPTPILEPAIEYDKDKWLPEMKAASQAIIEVRPADAERFLGRAGIAATNAAKRWFTNPQNGWPPNAPSTIARKGSDKRNIDTGQLRRSITYVVRMEGQVKETGEQTEASQ